MPSPNKSLTYPKQYEILLNYVILTVELDAAGVVVVLLRDIGGSLLLDRGVRRGVCRDCNMKLSATVK